MITDIPSAVEFENVGISLIDVAWSEAIEYILELEDFFEPIDHDDEMVQGFWKAAKLRLARAKATLQQGVEFLIKSRIASISPYLLILNSPSQFPKRSDMQPMPFSDFRTIDAQDLLKVHDTFANEKFDIEFKGVFEELRRFRNTTMHTVDKRNQVEAIEIITKVIEVYNFFFKDNTWIKERHFQLKMSPTAELNSSDFADPQIIREFNELFKILSPKNMKKLFDINKKQRWYLCPDCDDVTLDWDLKPEVAQLNPNTKNSSSIYCYICEDFKTVERTVCPHHDCKGNVLSKSHDLCLTCGDHI